MADVRLNFIGNVEDIKKSINSMKDDLTDVNKSYKSIDETTDKAAKGQTKYAKGIKGSNVELNKHIKEVNLLETQLKRLERGQKKTNDPKLIKKYNTEIAKTKGALAQMGAVGTASFAGINSIATATQFVLAKISALAKSAFLPLLAVGAISGILRNVIQSLKEFETAGASLSAITGQTGQGLEFLKQRAVELSVETGISAVDVVKAYELIGSKQPELLKNSEALAKVTEATLTLNRAMGGPLTDTATSLTGIMNQFKLGTEDVVKVTDILSNGSLEGAFTITQLSEALEKVGTTANNSNISLIETVAAAEAISGNFANASEVGTKLNAVFLKMSATEILPPDTIKRLEKAGVNISDMSDKTLSLSDRLRALQPIQNDANALTSLFGTANQGAASLVIQNADAIDDLTIALDKNGTAVEQAAKNSDTLAVAQERLQTKIDSLFLKSGGGFTKFLRDIVDTFRFTIIRAETFFSDLGDYVNNTVDDFFALGTGISTFFSELFKDGITGVFSNASDAAAKAEQATHDKLVDRRFQRRVDAIKFRKDTEAEENKVAEDALKESLKKQDEVKKKARQKLSEDDIKAAEKLAKEKIRIEKEISKLKIDLLKDGIDKDLAREDLRFDDLKEKLTLHNLDTSEATEQHYLNLFNIRKKYIDKAANDSGINTVDSIDFTTTQSISSVNDLADNLAGLNGGELTAEQSELISRLTGEIIKKQEDAINKINTASLVANQNARNEKESIEILEIQLGVQNEEKKQKAILQIKLKYAELNLSLLKDQGSKEGLELQKQIQDINGALFNIGKNEREGEEPKQYDSFLDLIGIDPKYKEGLGKFLSEAKQFLTALNDLRIEAAETAIKASQDEIDALDESIKSKEDQLQKEKDLSDDGFNNNVDGLEADILLLNERRAEEKRIQDEAIEDKKKAQKIQLAIDSATQLSGLITSSVNIYKSLSKLGPFGIGLAIATIATMFGSFTASKIKAAKAITAEKGIAGIREGKRHYEGGEPFIEMEAGEAFGVLSRGKTRSHGKPFVDLVNATNIGDLEGMQNAAMAFMNPNSANDSNGIINVNIDNGALKENSKAIIEANKLNKNKVNTVSVGNKTITKKGNTTKIVTYK